MAAPLQPPIVTIRNLRSSVVDSHRGSLTAPITQVITGINHQWENSVAYGPNYGDWMTRIAKGLQCTTKLSGTKQELSLSPGRLYLEFWTGNNQHINSHYRMWDVSGDLLQHVVDLSLPPPEDLAPADNLAREQFYAAVRKGITTFSGGVALGELRETLRMLRSPAKALRTHLQNYLYTVRKNKRRFKGKSEAKKKEFLADTWLEYSFGMLPFINDVRDAAQALDTGREYLDRNLINIRPRFGTIESTEILTGPSHGYAAIFSFTSKEKRNYRTQVKYYGAVANRRATAIRTEASVFGFDPTSFVPTLWELIPYSFLVDYFTNVGTVIDSWSLRKIDLAWGARTIHRQTISSICDVLGVLDPNDSYDMVSYSFFPGEFTAEMSSVLRDPIGVIEIPYVATRLPGFSTKWINMGALARTHRALLPF